MKPSAIICAFVFLISFTIPGRAAGQTVLYAASGGLTSGACGSWAAACELRYALANATNGQEIWVKAGTYKPTAGTDRTATFQLKAGVGLYGGFAGTETDRSQRNIAANVTVLSGDIGAPGNNSDNSYHVVTGAGNAVLDGFTISGGNANGNAPHDRGGGMYNSSAGPLVNNCTFSGNNAANGGGMYNESGNPTLANCTFNSNSAVSGGGIYNESSDSTLTNCTFTGNSAIGGGGMLNYFSSTTLMHCTFSGNSALYEGGGVYNSGLGWVTSWNSIFWGDTNGELSGTYYTVIYSIVQGGYIGTGNIGADPLLAPLGTYGGTTQTLALLPGSSAIDAAGNAAECPATDQRGMARPLGSDCDIGAFESQGFTLATTNGDNQAVWVYASFASMLSLTVTAHNAVEPVNGGVVTFTGPASGASIASTVTAPIANGTAAGGVTANAVPGSYSVTAAASGAANVSFSLTNLPDTEVPSVTAFAVSNPANSLSIPISVFTAADNNAVTGYLITTSSARPDAGAAGWSNTAPTNYTVVSAGTYTLYPWARDATGNVSALYGMPVQVGAYNVLHAVPGGLTSGFCGTWAEACELRYALANAVSGQEIRVAAGTYTPTAGSDRTATFQLMHGVALYGGFAGTETDRLQRNVAANVTILSGDIGNPGDTSDNSYHVVTGVDNAILDGFTITGGNANGGNGYPFIIGGGMLGYGSPTLVNCTFSGNNASVAGGGMYNGGNPTLTNCTFSGNSADYGGAMANYYGSPTLTNCVFIGNSAFRGGAMFNDVNGSPTLMNCVFTGNSAFQGGAMSDGGAGSTTLTNCTFSGNNAYLGGAMYNDTATSTIRNSILWGDSDGELYGTGYGVSYSVVQGGYAGTGNISSDPLLAPFDNYVGLTQTFALLPGSPAIDAANPADCPATDQRGIARPQGNTCDIGAFEFRGFGLTLAITGPGTVTSQSQNGVTYACVKGAGGICDSVTFSEGDTVTLTATGSNSSFSVWGGAITGSANPYTGLVMDADKSVAATFTANPALVKLNGSDSIYYTLISALADCVSGATILARDTAFSGGLTITAHTIKLSGGFPDATFTGPQTGYSTIGGKLTITGGKLIADRVKVGP